MQETQLYPRAISWKISVTPLGKYRPQTFSPDISRVHCPPNLPPLLFPTSTGNLNFNLTTSDGLDPAGGARLNFKWEVSPGQRPRRGCTTVRHHPSPPTARSNVDAATQPDAFTILGSRIARWTCNHAQILHRTFFPFQVGGEEISWKRNSFISMRSPLRFQSIDNFPFVYQSLPRRYEASWFLFTSTWRFNTWKLFTSCFNSL